jgi:hypothetical protein
MSKTASHKIQTVASDPSDPGAALAFGLGGGLRAFAPAVVHQP